MYSSHNFHTPKANQSYQQQLSPNKTIIAHFSEASKKVYNNNGATKKVTFTENHHQTIINSDLSLKTQITSLFNT